MSRWTPGKPIDQVMQCNVPFGRKDGHKVGKGKAAERTLTQAVKDAEASAARCNEALVEMRELARAARDMQFAVQARVRRAAWVIGACAAVMLGGFLWTLTRLGVPLW